MGSRVTSGGRWRRGSTTTWSNRWSPSSCRSCWTRCRPQRVKMTEDLDLKELLTTLHALRKGDFTVRMPIDHTGLQGKVADTLNDIIEYQAGMTKELARLTELVGKEGRIEERASLSGAGGSWAACIDSV